MNQTPQLTHHPKPTEEFGSLNPSIKKDLIAKGYMDQTDRPIGAGKHLVPLLIETLKATRALFNFTAAMFDENEELMAQLDPQPVFESFHQVQSKVRVDLLADGFEHVEDRFRDVILPQMNWVFCSQYSAWMARQVMLDLVMKDIRAFDEDHPDGELYTLQVFREFVKEKGAVWALSIVEKGIETVVDLKD
jgi:hypothetical protein